jgi:hypothetical protein
LGWRVIIFSDEGFRGRSLTADGTIANLDQYRFSDRAASAVVTSGKWEACEHPGFTGRCVILSPGSYGTLASVDMNGRISSLRAANDARVVYEARPDYWDVTYEFRGIQHNVQLRVAPSATIAVNRNGELIG